MGLAVQVSEGVLLILMSCEMGCNGKERLVKLMAELDPQSGTSDT